MRLNSSSKHKQNLEGLLRMAVENSGHELEASNNSVVADAENMMFLQEALNSMTTDFAPAYTNAIKDLQSESTTVDKKKDSLNIIRENIDDIDLANGFVKVGGALLLIQLIKETTDSDLRSKSAYIIAEMSQNNDFCQKYFNNENIIPYLSSTINDNNENVSRSSIFAISSLIQNYEPGLNSFLEANGIEMLVLGLDSKHSTVYTKAAFLIGSLSSQKSTIKDLFNRVNAASSLIKNLEDKSEYDQKLYVTLFAPFLTFFPIVIGALFGRTKLKKNQF
ncbi:hsp70 nucleotide exchange factor fes1 [Drosophila busckii]|uniref:hsp70 nucleotide exchange factor fes1 n=1 Tax=Drosophila busckii TaxID=30019 RepID=UPI001432D413|nr:hsp70 nucleotide exchange factor fes1 [Drosophila busckii]